MHIFNILEWATTQMQVHLTHLPTPQWQHISKVVFLGIMLSSLWSPCKCLQSIQPPTPPYHPGWYKL